MTQIDFYILGESSHRNINQMVCQLCEKALTQQMNVFIYTESSDQAQQLDDLLWTFKTDSFIAHENRLNKTDIETSYPYPVIISNDEVSSSYKHLLINLTANIPVFFKQFERVAELVGKESDEKEIARSRYRSYLQQGYTLNKYDL